MLRWHRFSSVRAGEPGEVIIGVRWLLRCQPPDEPFHHRGPRSYHERQATGQDRTRRYVIGVPDVVCG